MHKVYLAVNRPARPGWLQVGRVKAHCMFTGSTDSPMYRWLAGKGITLILVRSHRTGQRYARGVGSGCFVACFLGASPHAHPTSPACRSTPLSGRTHWSVRA